LVRAAFELFGDGDESAVTVRSVCRQAELNNRYFYESFSDTDELLGAVYDFVVTDLIGALVSAMSDLPDDRARLRAGITTVLSFSSGDPSRGKILFTQARTNPVLAARRSATQEQLRRSVLHDGQAMSRAGRIADLVSAAMYSGAMAELAQEWLSGTLGTDLEPVVESAVRLLMPARVHEPSRN
jgi:AcrR family transcriptional regulator